MKHTGLSVALALSASLVACKKDEKQAPEATPTAKSEEPAPTPEKPKPAAGPFASWDLDARHAAFEGAHVTPGGSLGNWEAWNVQGDQVVIWDGSEEKTLELALHSPCEVATTLRSPDGSSSGTVSHFTIKDGAIVMGLGDAGSRKGKEAIACISNKVFTLDAAGTCTEWERSMFGDGKYDSAPGTCGWKMEGDQEVFAATVHGNETTLLAEGDVLWSEQLARVHSEKLADFAAAKAARDAKK